MAMDFPASPSVGQTFNNGLGTTYIWDGITWNVIPQMAPAMASDTPPSNPSVGQFWWRSTNGQLYIYVNDGNTSQWVQAAGFAQVTGAWELIEKRTLVAVANQADFLNLDPFIMLRLTGFLSFSVNTAFGYRTSVNNGSSFDQGASDYATQSLTAVGTTVAAAQASTSLASATINNVSASAFETVITQFNKTTAAIFSTDVTDVAAAGTTANKELTGGFRNGAVARNALRLITTVVSNISGTLMLEGVRG